MRASCRELSAWGSPRPGRVRVLSGRWTRGSATPGHQTPAGFGEHEEGVDGRREDVGVTGNAPAAPSPHNVEPGPQGKPVSS